jgi:hypothetical protein
MAETPEIRDGGEAEGIDLPTPTAWPMIFALGLALLFAGLVTHVMVSCVGGALFLAGAVGWWFQVLPVEQHERVPLQAERLRPPPIEPQAAGVEHLRAGEQGHRLQLPIEMQPYSSGVRGGAAGAVAMAAVAMLYGLLAEGSLFYPINLLASAMMPSMDLADAETLRAFDAAALAAATLMHVGLSLLVGLVYAALLPALPGRTWLWGGIVAPILWTGVAWVSLGIVAPALNAHIQWGWFIGSQAAFGLTAGFVISRIEPVALLQRMDFAERAGIEAAGVVRPHDESEGDQ